MKCRMIVLTAALALTPTMALAQNTYVRPNYMGGYTVQTPPPAPFMVPQLGAPMMMAPPLQPPQFHGFFPNQPMPIQPLPPPQLSPYGSYYGSMPYGSR